MSLINRTFFLLLNICIFSHVSAEDNAIQRKNSLFLHRLPFMEELYKTNQISLSKKNYTRKELEDGEVLIELFKNPLYSPQEIYRIAHEEIEDALASGEKLTDQDQQNIFQRVFEEKAGRVDSQVIEGIAIAMTPGSVSKLVNIFLTLDNFKKYVPHVFLESTHLKNDFLEKKHIKKPTSKEFQFSKLKIASATFSHTLVYELSQETKKFGEKPMDYTVIAWEMAPQFSNDTTYGPKGVLMNNGTLLVQPYLKTDGTIDASRSVIIYHIYIKVDPLNSIMQLLSDIFKDSIAKSVIHDLAYAMRKEAGHN